MTTKSTDVIEFLFDRGPLITRESFSTWSIAPVLKVGSGDSLGSLKNSHGIHNFLKCLLHIDLTTKPLNNVNSNSGMKNYMDSVNNQNVTVHI